MYIIASGYQNAGSGFRSLSKVNSFIVIGPGEQIAKKPPSFDLEGGLFGRALLSIFGNRNHSVMVMASILRNGAGFWFGLKCMH